LRGDSFVATISTQNNPSILVLTGASGAGKTTLLLKLAEIGLGGVECINCDRVQMERPASGDPSDYQSAILQHWLNELWRRNNKVELAVLDTQIRPHRAIEVLGSAGVVNYEMVLVDCEPSVRNKRLLTERQQPELVTAQMDCWAAYLRGQADALGLTIIDTSSQLVEDSLEDLMSVVSKFFPTR
jgi:energy-coupling factor transporter ATP-binding protein EcfA2